LETVKVFLAEGVLLLQARNAELVIMNEHVVALKKIGDIKDFNRYFLEKALLNRSARKLFQSLTRRNNELRAKIYQKIHYKQDSPNEEKCR